MPQFEFVHYGEDAATIRGTHTFPCYGTDSAAKNAAGRLAKRIKGPVDIARAGGAPWSERYLTTAAPSPHHTAGFRFERLTN